MKASASVLCSVVAAAYLAAHLPLLAPSLEDIDSINFALGLRDFDVAQHQPHPPGYPVYIALGRASSAVIERLAPGMEQARAEALALAVWSAIAGAVALIAACAVFRAIQARTGAAARAPALWATALLAVSPLFWITGLRPLSDMPGLAAVLTAQALLLQWRPIPFLIGAALCGLAAGIRSQTLLLTVPLLAWRLFELRGAGVAPLAMRSVLAAAAGVLAWAIPLLAAAGGLREYATATAGQLGEAEVEMLWANPSARRAAFAAYDTIVLPWASPVLAAAVTIAALAGVVAMLRRERAAFVLLLAAFAPYAVFHLLVQETVTVRYALPVLVPAVWLAARGLATVRRVAPVLQIALVTAAAVVAIPGGVLYSAEPHPAFRAIADMDRAAAVERPAAVHTHYAVRRPLQARPPAGVPVVEPPRTGEWKGLVDYWRGGGAGEIWFLADPRRTDLALIDPQARRHVRSYRWAAAARPELSGARPIGVDWYRFEPPGWFAGEGWSLTPELGGVTQRAGTGIDRRPIEALVRRRADRMIAVIGARHLGSASDGGAVLTAALDGQTVGEWALDPAKALNVLRVVHLPPGALKGPGEYARLTLSARPLEAGRSTPPLAIRQFDIQPETALLHAFDEGWHEEEYDNATGRRWRWSSDRSVLRILPPQAVRVRLRGESPLRYFDAPPLVRVTAGDEVIAEMRPEDDFDWTITVPADAVHRADGRIALETTPVYLPGVAEGSRDERRLGLRLFDIDVAPVQP